MRLTLDATPLLGRRTGIGRYVRHLVDELPAAVQRRGLDAEVRATTWTARGGRLVDLPPGVRQVGPRVPARLLREAWRRGGFPPIELLVGATEVFHGTNFMSPPTRRAREVVTVHDLTYVLHAETVTADSLLYRELVPRALERGALVLTPTDAVGDAVREHYGLPHDRVRTTPLGVDDAWFTAGPPSGSWLSARGLPPRYVVFVGSLDPRKNLHTLLSAHDALHEADSSVPPLVLAGPAGRERALGHRPGVHLTGWLEDDELRALVAGAACLVLPSLDEGFGLPVLEALACGRPVVVSDVAALREVGGPHVVVAPTRDAEGLAAAVERACAAPSDDAARAGRRAWAQRFTWSACADRTLDAYLAA